MSSIGGASTVSVQNADNQSQYWLERNERDEAHLYDHDPIENPESALDAASANVVLRAHGLQLNSSYQLVNMQGELAPVSSDLAVMLQPKTPWLPSPNRAASEYGTLQNGIKAWMLDIADGSNTDTLTWRALMQVVTSGILDVQLVKDMKIALRQLKTEAKLEEIAQNKYKIKEEREAAKIKMAVSISLAVVSVCVPSIVGGVSKSWMAAMVSGQMWQAVNAACNNGMEYALLTTGGASGKANLAGIEMQKLQLLGELFDSIMEVLGTYENERREEVKKVLEALIAHVERVTTVNNRIAQI